MRGRVQLVKDVRSTSDLPEQNALLAGQAGRVPKPVDKVWRVVDGREEGDGAGGGGGGDLQLGG